MTDNDTATTEEMAPTRHAAEDAETERLDTRPDCWHCYGTGKAVTLNDHLRRSLELFPTDNPAAMDGIVAEFYRRYIAHDEGKAEGDKLVTLFPADLTTGDALNSKGHHQRDIFLDAVVGAIAEYDPDNPTSPGMRAREAALERAGRSHWSFNRPDGTARPPSAEEYAEAFDVLAGLIRDAFGEAWRPEWDGMWAEAYDDAVTVMRYSARRHRWEQEESQGTRDLYGRNPRQAR